MNLIEHVFLDSFFSLFEARTEIIKIKNNIVFGTVLWENDEDTQDFKWSKPFDNDTLIALTDLCVYLFKNDLLVGDRIRLMEELLVERLKNVGWPINKINMTIDALMSLEIKMLDEGKETDSFFIHF